MATASDVGGNAVVTTTRLVSTGIPVVAVAVQNTPYAGVVGCVADQIGQCRAVAVRDTCYARPGCVARRQRVGAIKLVETLEAHTGRVIAEWAIRVSARELVGTLDTAIVGVTIAHRGGP